VEGVPEIPLIKPPSQEGNIRSDAIMFFDFSLTQGFTPAKQALYRLSYASNLFCSGYFGGGVSRTVCLGWP
jgi:hypothetical protein